jgi:hypothetical protein
MLHRQVVEHRLDLRRSGDARDGGEHREDEPEQVGDLSEIEISLHARWLRATAARTSPSTLTSGRQPAL